MRALLVSIAVVAVTLALTYQSPSPIQPRNDYGARLEPTGRIMHGAGQDVDGFRNYWMAMDEDEKPIAYMYYIGLRNVGTTWVDRLKTDLRRYGDQMIVLQVGFELTADGNPYTDDIVRGALDDDIDTVLDGLQEIGLPVYLRIGYEFNGVAWNGYQPDSYRGAFRYITNKIRERDAEIATVWNFAPDGVPNFMSYFPGDEYVDWWAFNPFSSSHLADPAVYSFLDSSHVHDRPVLIGESTPRYVGTTGGQSSWDQWFEPFFELIRTRPGIKMFCYINWNWVEWPQWSDWGDARLEANQVVRDLYASEMDSSVYLHSGTEKGFRSLLGYNDSIAPGPVAGVAIADTTYPARLVWNPATDPSGIARYLVFKRDTLYDWTGVPRLDFDFAGPGDTMQVTVLAIDRAGNAGPASEEIVFTVPPRGENPADQIVNGDFEHASDPWELVTFVGDASAAFEIDTSNPIDGSGSAHVRIAASTGTNWHIQLRHPVRLSARKRYVISYQARASDTTSIETWIQQDHSPFSGYAFQSVRLTPETQSYTDTAFVDVDDTAFLTFMTGNSGTPEIWIDNVSAIEEDWGPGHQEELLLENGNFENGLDPWILDRSGLAHASIELDASGLMEGQNSARITVQRTTNTNWHIQLRQRMTVREGSRYEISYQAQADRETTFETWLQQDHAPYAGLLQKTVALTTEVQTFADTVDVDVDDTVFLAYMMGDSGLSQIWIDDISVRDLSVVTGLDHTAADPSSHELYAPFPNPFAGTTRLQFAIPDGGIVSLKVYDALGREVATLFNGFAAAGRHEAEWTAPDLASGSYFVRLKVDKRHIRTRPVVFLH